MVSTGNKSKLVSSNICQTCGRCCKEFNMYCDVNCALRFLWIDERKIKPTVAPFRLPFNQGVEHNIKFKFPCSQLEFTDGKYRCKVWDKERPDFCNTYPDHIFYDCEEWNTDKIKKLLEYESQVCPALKNVTVEDVVKMLGEVRKG